MKMTDMYQLRIGDVLVLPGTRKITVKSVILQLGMDGIEWIINTNIIYHNSYKLNKNNPEIYFLRTEG